MSEDIRVKIGADVSEVEKALRKVIKNTSKVHFPPSPSALLQTPLGTLGKIRHGGMKTQHYKYPGASVSSKGPTMTPFSSAGSKTGTFERASATLKELGPKSNVYQSHAGSSAISNEPNKKTLSEAFKLGYSSISKKQKQELWWKWFKGTYTNIAKILHYSSLMNAFFEIISAALDLIGTAILLPFLDDILGVLTWLLDASVAFFDWMDKNKEGVRGTAQLGFEAIVAGLGLTGLVKVFGWLSEKVLSLIPGFKLLEKAFAPVIEWLAEKGLLGALKGIVAWVAKFVDPLLWATLIADISSYIFGWIQGWSDNPVWQAFWGGMKGLADIVAEITDVFGWVIDIFTGKGFDRVGKIAGDIFDLGDGIKKTIGITNSLVDLKPYLGPSRGSYTNLKPEDLPSQYQHADGGIFNKPTMGVIAEAGPEAVIPLDQLKDFGGKGNTTITVNGLVDERKFREMIQSVVNQTLNRTYNIRGATY